MFIPPEVGVVLFSGLRFFKSHIISMLGLHYFSHIAQRNYFISPTTSVKDGMAVVKQGDNVGIRRPPALQLHFVELNPAAA